jgi:Transglycosylase SLT domain
MPIPATFNRISRTVRSSADRMTRRQQLSAAGVAVIGAGVLAFSVVPGSAHAANPSNPVMGAAMAVGASQGATPTPTAAATHAPSTDLGKQLAQATKKADNEVGTQASAARKAVVKRAVTRTAVERVHPRAHHVHAHKALKVKTVAESAPSYPDNLNGWIEQALSVMHQHNIPGSYEGIHRNIMRESSGNPNAINNWDVNAQNGIPSKGLLQVIPPTFSTYHVSGTPQNIYNPVSNIVAACNYASHRYGSIDNVNSAY